MTDLDVLLVVITVDGALASDALRAGVKEHVGALRMTRKVSVRVRMVLGSV